MHRPFSPFGPRFAGVLLAVLLTACGGGDGGSADSAPPTATIDVPGGRLDKAQAIVIRFSESMNVASLALGGDIGAGAQASWSRGAHENDTLTLAPRSGAWPAGDGRQLVVDARDPGGNAMASLRATYVVPLQFANFQDAGLVVGQQDFTASTSNQGGPVGPGGLDGPYGAVAVAPGGRFFVPDYNNNRVLVFSAVPGSNGAEAEFVLGQPDFSSRSGSIGRERLNSPQSTSIANERLVVSDFANNRVLIYNTIPAAGGALPDVVIGQLDFLSSDETCGPRTLRWPEAAVLTEDGKLLVADAGHRRVLIWNQLPATNGQAPDLVLGQSDFSHCATNDDDQDGITDAPSARTLSSASGVWSDGQRVAVVDRGNNRVLIWNTFPSSNFQPADLVLGQSDFVHDVENDDDQDGVPDAAASARVLNGPYSGITSNGVQLAVADSSNNRVLVWNTFPTRSFQPADVVLGQGSFSQVQRNDSDGDGVGDATASGRTLFGPMGVFFRKERLFVSDKENNRILVFGTQ